MAPLNAAQAWPKAQDSSQEFKPKFLYAGDILRDWIIDKGQDIQAYGEGNFLFVCLEALLRLHAVATSPDDIDFIYRPQTMSGVPDNTIESWRRTSATFRLDLSNYQEALLALQDFVPENFRSKDRTFAVVFDRVYAKYARHVKRLEQADFRLKEQVNTEHATIATNMAQISIKESKRMMLSKSQATSVSYLASLIMTE